MKGNTGKIIQVDLTSGAVDRVFPPEEDYRMFVGGSGLAAKIFWDRANFHADPLSPEALLMFLNGPFAGLKLSGASRFSTAGRSPLTGNWGDSSCGGWFAPELRYAGYDGILLIGRSPNPVMLVIEDASIRLESADMYWGNGIESVTRSLKERFGKTARTLVIGPAGENQVPFAAILNEAHHAFGRVGFGAVMGSKNLKAIVVKAKVRTLDLADPEAFEAMRGELNERIRTAVASDVLHTHGTAANLEGGVYSGDVPIRNFTSNFSQEMGEALNGAVLSETYLTHPSACAYCGIACKRNIEIPDGPYAVPKGPGPEYETIVSLGSLIGCMDLAAVCKAGRLCNDLGLDTITTGATIAWAMEAWECGDLSAEDTEDHPLRWGDIDMVIDVLIPAIASRAGKLGGLLSLGSAAAAASIGKGSEYTVHSKGLEVPAHDPRGGGHGLALAYAVSPRGACHVAFPILFMEMGACYYPEIGFEYELEPMTDEHKPETVAIAVALGSIENSACFCQFADREITIPEWVTLFRAVAGYDWDVKAMMRAGKRIFYLKRLINYRFGRRAADDTLTPRVLEPARDGEPEGVEIRLDRMKDRFYQLMELDPETGIPTREALEACGLSDAADRIR
jgi:aldehyde:ferredoxin oxidoreductase